MSDRPWLASYPPEVPHSLAPYPEKSLYSVLEETVARFADRPAVSFFGKKLSYRQLSAEVDQDVVPTLTLSSYGRAADVAVPPASQTADAERALEAVGEEGD